jgi:hypothetical protein
MVGIEQRAVEIRGDDFIHSEQASSVEGAILPSMTRWASNAFRQH